MAQDVGTGTTIAFGTSNFTADLLSLDSGGASRESYETTHMGTTGDMTFSPKSLVDRGTIDIEIAFDPDDQPPIAGAPETITITFPIPAGGSSGATLVGSGFVTEWAFSVPLEERKTATATIKWAAGVTWSPSA